MNAPRSLSRRTVLQALSAVGIGSLAFQRSLAAQVAESGELTAEMVKQAEWVADFELSDEERESVAKSLRGTLESAASIRKIAIDVDTAPAQVFRPDFFYAIADGAEAGAKSPQDVQIAWSVDSTIQSLGEEDLAFASIKQQASLLASKKLSSRELTQLYLGRLKKYDPVLKCVVTLLEEHALQSADASDERRAKGASHGVHDGIPWVAKDLIAMPPWKTTWVLSRFESKCVRRQRQSRRRWLSKVLWCWLK